MDHEWLERMSRYGNMCEMAISRKALIADDFCGPLARPNKAQCKSDNNHPSLHAVVMWENEGRSRYLEYAEA